MIGPANVPHERQFSWIVALLPYLEQQELYDALRLDLPCDHPHNAGLLQSVGMLELLRCPSDPTIPTTQEGMYRTSYVAVTGADFSDGPGNPRGVIGFDRGLSVSEIHDGTNNTILVAEVTDGGPWYAGGHGTARQIDDWIRNASWSNHPGGGMMLFADAHARFLSNDIDSQTLRHLATAQAGDLVEDYDSDYGYNDELSSESDSAPSGLPKDLAAREQAAPQQAQPTRLAEQAVKVPAAQAGERARLSLRVALETHGQPAIQFRREGGAGQLSVRFQDGAFAHVLRWAVVAAVLLAAWIVRRASVIRRAVVLTIVLAAPIGLSGVVPLSWTPLLDGLLLGGLAAVVLWLLLGLLAASRGQWKQSLATILAVGIGLGMLSATAQAQQADDLFGPSATANQKQQPASAEGQPPTGLTLFIPYDPDQGDPLQNTKVYMPHDEFLQLWKQAHPVPPKPAKPEVPAMVSFAEYVGRLDGDAARFDGRIVVHHLDDQWARLPLPIGKVALQRVAVDGQTATLDGDPPGIYLERPGVRVVDVRFQVPIHRLGATGRMTLPLGAVPSGRVLLQIPGEDLDVQVDGATGGWRLQSPQPVEDDNAPSSTGRLVEVPLGKATDLSIRWQPRQVEVRADQLVSVDQSLLVEVLNSGVHYHGRFQYQVQQGAVRRVQFRIPDGLDIAEVEGSQVADWSVESGSPDGSEPAARRLAVTLKAEQSAGFELAVEGFRPLPSSDHFEVQFAEPLGVARETGRIAVGCSSHFQVKAGRMDRLTQINHTELQLPRKLADSCSLLLAYRYNSRPWQLTLQAKRRQPRVEVTDRTAIAVTARQVTMQSLLSVEVAEAPIPSLVLQVPPSLRIAQVRVPDGADWFVDRDDRGQRVQVQLSEPVTGRLDLAIRGTIARNPDQPELVVPQVQVEEVQSQQGQLAIRLDEDLEAVLVDDGGARSIAPSALDRVLQPQGRNPMQYAFRYDVPPTGLQLRLSTAPSRTNADVTTVVSVREGAVAYISQIRFDIQQAGQSRFSVVVPEWLGEDIEWQGDRIRQIRSQVSGAQRTWLVELQQPVRGAYLLQMMQVLPLPEDGTVAAALVRPLDAERVRSRVVLENRTADETTAVTSRGTSAIPLSELPVSLSDEVRRQAVAAYRITGADAQLTWRRRIREQEAGLAATIGLADIATVIHPDGRYRARASYNIRNFRLQFLEIELPHDSQVWAVHVSGQPVRPAKREQQGRTITLLPLQKTSAGDFSSKVDLIWSGRLEGPLSRWGEVRPPAPRLVSNIPVSRTLWTVYMPRQYAIDLDDQQSNLEGVAAMIQQEERKLSFLDELGQMVQVASSKGRSNAGAKARDNLMQLGSALSNYSQQDLPINAQVDAGSALAVQRQAQQIEAEIRQLEQSDLGSQMTDGGIDFYFQKPTSTSVSLRAGGRLSQTLNEQQLPMMEEGLLQPRDAIASDKKMKASRQDLQRGRMREQAVDQLERLQSKRREMKVQQPESATVPAFENQPSSTESETLGSTASAAQSTPSLGQSEGAQPPQAAKAGYLSLDLDLVPVGVAYHFRKLQGNPRLVLETRHEEIGRWAIAVLWAAICLVLAAAVIVGMRRPNAAELAQRNWPWFAAAAGAAWLFLLSVSFGGVVLMLAALWGLKRRVLARRANPASA